MSKKRKKFRSSHSSWAKKTVKRNLTTAQHKMENSILALLYSSKKPVTTDMISIFLLKNGHAEHDITDTINILISKKIIRKTGKNQFGLEKSAPLYEGTLEKNPKGFGFIINCVSFQDARPLSKDPYISLAMCGSAHHGDKVLIRILKTRNDGRSEGMIIKTISQGRDTIAGFYYRKKHGGTVSPEDPRFPFQIAVKSSTVRPNHGDAVIVRIQRHSQPAGTIAGEIVEILGNPDNIDVQMRLVIEKFSLPHAFSGQAMAEAENLSDSFTPTSERIDLRDIAHVTIDGETAKDFDDAVCVKKTRNGFNLYVSIADVSYFVKPGSRLDKEAYTRGTSIYFPGRVIPMLPEKLSNNICSLVPDEDRFTVTAILSFDRQGKLLKKDFVRSIIRSHHRFTYTTVKQILIDKDPDVRRRHKAFLTQLKWANELATALYDKRKKRGSIGFTIPEPAISLSDTGEISTISVVKRNFAHQIIEEFMLAANEAVASLFSQKKCKGLYRVHEQPDAEKVAGFCSFAKTLDIHLPKTDSDPAWFAGIIEQCKGSRMEYIVNNLLLRTMKQAQYSTDNVGHFGLASADYTHFTSPIRRYPDLMVHRELIRTIEKANIVAKEGKPPGKLEEKAGFLSTRERIAIRAEREMGARLKCRYMKKHIGETFEAIISGVNDFALFVELKDIYISGSIGIKNLTDDYYIHDEKRYRLIGELSGTIYQMGDAIQVTLVDVDTHNNRINFIPSTQQTS